MATTAKLGITKLTARQVLKYVTINKAFDILDKAIFLDVINQTTTAPPGSPTEGDAYIIGTGATGAWAGKDKDVAIYLSGAWHYITKIKGLVVYDLALNQEYIYDGANWVIYFINVRRTIDFNASTFINESGAVQQTLTFTNVKADSWNFTNGSDDEISTTFTLPKHADYQNVNIRIFSTNTVTATGDIRWRVRIYNIEDAEDIDAATVVTKEWTDSQSGNTQNFLMLTTSGQFNLNASVTESSLLVMKIMRESTHAEDNFNQDVNLLLLKMEYIEKHPLDASW